jgi:hypothetical protein
LGLLALLVCLLIAPTDIVRSVLVNWAY